jgi:hypothetical protein
VDRLNATTHAKTPARKTAAALVMDDRIGGSGRKSDETNTQELAFTGNKLRKSLGQACHLPQRQVKAKEPYAVDSTVAAAPAR